MCSERGALLELCSGRHTHQGRGGAKPQASRRLAGQNSIFLLCAVEQHQDSVGVRQFYQKRSLCRMCPCWVKDCIHVLLGLGTS